jgi:hypothetical protein
MATKEQIIEAILKVAGDPTVGVIKDLAEDFADAIISLDTPVAKETKETRVVKSEETR